MAKKTPITPRWDEVRAGMHVELKGDKWLVDKLKVKGKRVRVTVTGKAGTFTRDVAAKDRVTLWREPEVKLHRKLESNGRPAKAQERWATEEEAAALPEPNKGRTGSWGKATDKTEAELVELLGAKLVAVKREGEGGYWVPPVDPSTVASHLLIYHGIDGGAMVDYAKARRHELTHTQAQAEALVEWAELKAMHDAEHEQALTQKVPHWHSPERPL